MYKLLILDDEHYNHILLKDILEDYPARFEVIEAQLGDVGLELIIKEKPDLVFLDRMLPIINGLEICRIIKGRPELKDTKVVVISALKLSPQDQECLADAYLQKPYNSHEIKDTLKRLLEKKVIL